MRHRALKYTLAALLIAGSITALALTARQASQGPAVPGVVGTHTENGLAGFAKILCSAVFVSGRTPEDVAQGSAYFFMPRGRAGQGDVHRRPRRASRLARRSARSTREARYYGDQGCIIQNPSTSPGIHFTPVAGHDDAAGRGDAAVADGRSSRTRRRCRRASTRRSSTPRSTPRSPIRRR